MGSVQILPSLEELKSAVQRDFRRWKEVYNKGCPADPFYKDGVNLNLVRNHIIYDVNRLGEVKVDPWDLPDEYFYPIPPKFPLDYMAVDRYYPVHNKLEKSTKTLSYNDVVSDFDWSAELMWIDLLIKARGE